MGNGLSKLPESEQTSKIEQFFSTEWPLLAKESRVICLQYVMENLPSELGKQSSEVDSSVVDEPALASEQMVMLGYSRDPVFGNAEHSITQNSDHPDLQNSSTSQRTEVATVEPALEASTSEEHATGQPLESFPTALASHARENSIRQDMLPENSLTSGLINTDSVLYEYSTPFVEQNAITEHILQQSTEQAMHDSLGFPNDINQTTPPANYTTYQEQSTQMPAWAIQSEIGQQASQQSQLAMQDFPQISENFASDMEIVTNFELGQDQFVQTPVSVMHYEADQQISHQSAESPAEDANYQEQAAQMPLRRSSRVLNGRITRRTSSEQQFRESTSSERSGPFRQTSSGSGPKSRSSSSSRVSSSDDSETEANEANTLYQQRFDVLIKDIIIAPDAFENIFTGSIDHIFVRQSNKRDDPLEDALEIDRKERIQCIKTRCILIGLSEVLNKLKAPTGQLEKHKKHMVEVIQHGKRSTNYPGFEKELRSFLDIGERYSIISQEVSPNAIARLSPRYRTHYEKICKRPHLRARQIRRWKNWMPKDDKAVIDAMTSIQKRVNERCLNWWEDLEELHQRFENERCEDLSNEALNPNSLPSPFNYNSTAENSPLSW